MTQPVYDIAILGAGPVGQVLALLLAHRTAQPQRIALFAGATAPASNPAPTPAADPRVLAMNHGSRVLLESLNTWPKHAAEIRDVHVSQRGRLGSTVIHSEDFDVPRLGSVVAYAELHAALQARVAESGITVLHGPPAKVLQQDNQGVLIQQGDMKFRCGTAVLSDGSGGRDIRREYDQHAIITTARATLPRKGWAWERFTREGPLALLPHPMDANAYSVVWCNSPERTAELTQLDDAAFSVALSDMFGTRLGRLSSAGPRHIFPLSMSARHHLAQGRVVAIGNAAQTLHPVAGQGLNLGLRDAARLAQALTTWLSTTAESPNTLLADFANARRADRWVTAGLTDLMPRAFATKLSPIEHVCGLGLLTLDMAAPLRAPLARHLLQGLRT
jgi:2-octaprenyl-6-methoxyphenol hydroxylase